MPTPLRMLLSLDLSVLGVSLPCFVFVLESGSALSPTYHSPLHSQGNLHLTRRICTMTSVLLAVPQHTGGGQEAIHPALDP